jgi:hypothetical protein
VRDARQPGQAHAHMRSCAGWHVCLCCVLALWAGAPRAEPQGAGQQCWDRLHGGRAKGRAGQGRAEQGRACVCTDEGVLWVPPVAAAACLLWQVCIVWSSAGGLPARMHLSAHTAVCNNSLGGAGGHSLPRGGSTCGCMAHNKTWSCFEAALPAQQSLRLTPRLNKTSRVVLVHALRAHGAASLCCYASSSSSSVRGTGL